jgi:hypothetical protein
MKKQTITLWGGLAILALVLTPATTALALGNVSSYDKVAITKNDCNIVPQVNFTETAKNGGYYYNLASNVSKGSKLKIGYNTVGNLTKKSAENYNKLKKYTKIKSVQWYTKDSKGKLKVVSKKAVYTVGDSAVGKLLYARYSYTCAGVPGTFYQTRFLGSKYYNVDYTAVKFVPIAKYGVLKSSVSIKNKTTGSYYGSAKVGNELQANLTVWFNRGIDRREDWKANAATHKNSKYQWYQEKDGAYYKIPGATKATYKVTNRDRGYSLYVYTTSTAPGYAPTASAGSFRNPVK